MSAPNLIVVVPVCRADFHLAIKWLKWVKRMDAQYYGTDYPIDIVLFLAASVEQELRDQLDGELDGVPNIAYDVNPIYYEVPELGYAAMANQMFRQALEMVELKFPGRPMLWCEPDCIPLQEDWIRIIQADYYAAGKPFMGDFHAPGKIPHMTGNAVYPPDWRTQAPSLALLPNPRPQQGWDSMCAHETVPKSHRSCRIQQTWLVPTPRFTADNIKMIHPEAVLFHRCKDGTLIDVLCEKRGWDLIPLGDAITGPAPLHGIGKIEIVPKANQTNVHIFIVSCARDADMLDYCLRSIAKNAVGYSGVTVMVPNQDMKAMKAVPRISALDEGIKMVGYIETGAGKGFLNHLIVKCMADEWCPDADYIVHVDSDCLMWRPSNPTDFVAHGKCLMIREDYKPLEKRNPNRLIWRDTVQLATGIVATHDVMVRHPQVYPRELYAYVRNLVEKHTGAGFEEYVLSCENGWPQSFAEFPTIGTVGLTYFRDAFKVVDYDHAKDIKDLGLGTDGFQYAYQPERDAFVEGWSHAGLGRYKADWDNFMAGKLPKFYLK